MISVGRILKPNYFENNPQECHSNPNYVMLYMAKSFDKELSDYTTVMRVYPGDTKFTTYRDLKKDGRYEDILIPTFEMNGFEDLMGHLDEFTQVILKPVLGGKGVGVIKLAKDSDKYHLIEKNGSSCLSEQELKDYYSKNLSQGHILQKYIECCNRLGEPYDFRIWSVDEGDGNWATAVYPRAGAKEGILSNVDAGGGNI